MTNHGVVTLPLHYCLTTTTHLIHWYWWWFHDNRWIIFHPFHQ